MQCPADIAPTEVHIIWGLLGAIPGLEMPIPTITDLGMIRSVARHGDGWVIGFTPTYSDCPATKRLLGEIRTVMGKHGFLPVHIILQLDPPQTIDQMNQEVRERLRQYGVGPPQGHACHADMPAKVSCPRYGNTHTSLINELGSTTCKTLCRCDSCHEPFDCFRCT